MNSSLLKAYALYFLFLDEKKIATDCKKITANELWELRVIYNVLDGDEEVFFKRNLKYIQEYLTKKHGYKTGSIKDFIESKISNFEGNFSDLMGIISENKLKEREEARKRKEDLWESEQNYDREDDHKERRRELDRDNFDALTDGQYGSFENFNGDYDNLKDSMGL